MLAVVMMANPVGTNGIQVPCITRNTKQVAKIIQTVSPIIRIKLGVF